MEIPFRSQFRSLWALFLWRGDAVQNEADRSRQRYRQAFLTTLASIGTRGIAFLTSIVTVRWTLHYLGTERYGMWVTISSFLALLSFADLGLGNGLINVVAEGVGRKDREAIQRAVSSAIWMLIVVAALLLCVGAFAYPFLHPERLLNVRSAQAMREAGPALAIFFLCFVANLPMGAVNGIQMGLQRAYITNLWSIGGSIGSLIALWIAMKASVGLPGLILALIGPGLVFSGLNGAILFGISRPDLRPAFSAMSIQTATRLLRIGFMFFILQIAISVAIQTDNLVIAHILGASAVADYAVPGRMFNMVNGMVAIISFAMWPAFAEASARSDRAWVRKGYYRIVKASVGGALVAVAILTLAGNRILAIWVGPQVHASNALLIWFALQCLVLAYLQPVGVLLNGLSEFNFQVKYAIVTAGLNLALSIVCVRKYGIVGAAMGTVLSFLSLQVVPFTLHVSKLLAEPSTRAVSAIQTTENT